VAQEDIHKQRLCRNISRGFQRKNLHKRCNAINRPTTASTFLQRFAIDGRDIRLPFDGISCGQFELHLCFSGDSVSGVDVFVSSGTIEELKQIRVFEEPSELTHKDV
jgi:hypothetical protein